MMINDDKDDYHVAISGSIYEEIKDISSEESSAWLHAHTARVMDQYGFRIASSVEHIAL